MDTVSLTPWSWRFRVGFAPELARYVRQHIRHVVPAPEREILSAVLAICQKFVSLDQLIEASGQTPQRAHAWTRGLSQKTLLPVPDALVPVLEEKIHQTPLGPSTARRLHGFLREAQKMGDPGYHRQILEVVFGASHLNKLLSRVPASREPVLVPEGNRVSPRDLPQEAKVWIDILQKRPALQDAFGPLPEYWGTSIRPEAGWGEFWPRELTGRPRDLLVLKDNETARRLHNLKLTLIHEVYPGHGWMYQNVRRWHPPHFDHGAVALVEGWATWCDWHVEDTPAARNTRRYRLSLLDTFEQPVHELPSTFQQIARQFGYPAEVAQAALMNRSQYPGLEFSYTLGAIAFEQLLAGEVPRRWFARRSANPLGDYFQLWWA